MDLKNCAAFNVCLNILCYGLKSVFTVSCGATFVVELHNTVCDHLKDHRTNRRFSSFLTAKGSPTPCTQRNRLFKIREAHVSNKLKFNGEVSNLK